MKYILVYSVEGYPYENDGTYYIDFEKVEHMDSKVNELAAKYKDDFSVIFAGYCSKEIEYEPVEIITEYRRK